MELHRNNTESWESHDLSGLYSRKTPKEIPGTGQSTKAWDHIWPQASLCNSQQDMSPAFTTSWKMTFNPDFSTMKLLPQTQRKKAIFRQFSSQNLLSDGLFPVSHQNIHMGPQFLLNREEAVRKNSHKERRETPGWWSSRPREDTASWQGNARLIRGWKERSLEVGWLD